MRLLSPAIKAASAFTLGGAAFAVANLLLARHLSTQDYGHFSLILAITLLSIPLGPLGLDAVVLRHRPGPQSRLLKLSILTGGFGGLLIATLAWVIYSIEPEYLALIAIAIAAGTVTRSSASVYQSETQYKSSLWLIQSQNITLILATIAAGLFIEVSRTMVFFGIRRALGLGWDHRLAVLETVFGNTGEQLMESAVERNSAIVRISGHDTFGCPDGQANHT